jgi:hypothetical protein
MYPDTPYKSTKGKKNLFNGVTSKQTVSKYPTKNHWLLKLCNLIRIIKNIVSTIGDALEKKMAKVMLVKHERQADIRIFEVGYESQADLCWFQVDYDHQAQGEALWHIVEYDHQADVKVFKVKYESQADLMVCKVKYENQAGWKNEHRLRGHLRQIQPPASGYSH